MPLYDYECMSCHAEVEKPTTIAERHNQRCQCGSNLIMVFKPTPRYKPFQSYFDLGLGVEITGRDHRRRVMRDLGMDFRDHPSKGEESARKDKRMRARQEAIKQGITRPHWGKST